MLENHRNLPASLTLILFVFPKPRSDHHGQTSPSGSLTHGRPSTHRNATRRRRSWPRFDLRLDPDPRAALLLKGKRLRETTAPNTPSSQTHSCGSLTVFRPFPLSHHLYSYSQHLPTGSIYLYLSRKKKKRHTPK